MNDVELIKEKNDYFRNWILKEWMHHNTVDPIYQLVIKKPEELTFLDNEEYYKIIFNNNEVGFIGIKNYKREIYLYRFYIDEEYRHQGIGTKVLNKLINLAKEENKDISLDVMENNLIAKEMYEKMGFKTHYTNMVLKINDNIYDNID